MSTALAVAAFFATACGTSPVTEVGSKIPALDDSAWDSSMWISVVNAPVITKEDREENDHAARGANWFMSTVKNEKQVTSAKWMATGLGVFELFINGKPVGKEVLKPGFTHYAKTKRSFTYDITEAFKTKSGAENILSAQVTPGWWADKIVTPGGVDGMIGKKCAFRSVLELTVLTSTTGRLESQALSSWLPSSTARNMTPGNLRDSIPRKSFPLRRRTRNSTVKYYRRKALRSTCATTSPSIPSRPMSGKESKEKAMKTTAR